MARRREAEKREPTPDSRFQDTTVSMFINKIMKRGKKSLAERIVYGSFDIVKEKTGKDPLEVFKAALNNVKPVVETRSRRIGGANYQVPVEVRPERQIALAMRWIIEYSRERSEKTMQDKLAGELMDAFNNRGNAIKKREDTHKMAAANKAFAHYRW
ncbi:MAG: 30S ribosomal protein S7 [Desulfobacterota bacterium]|nr:30S ribosomal protein S7 [Thermodesulfobacteriota bacterium]